MTSPKNYIRLLSALFLVATFSGCQILQKIDNLLSNQDGIYHTVQKGQTLYLIAQAYDTDINRLKRINGIYDPTKIQVGTRLWIPRARQVLEIDSKKRKKVVTQKNRRKKNSSKVANVPRKTVKSIKGFLIWPVIGQLTSKFGNRNGRHHDGIDIAAPKGSPIVAAADGKVMFSGWGPTGYGLMVIIKHKKKLTTVYAHNSHIRVHKNQTVRQGQRIASVGSTGRSTGPHLHFEVRNDTHPQNPFNYLQKQ